MFQNQIDEARSTDAMKLAEAVEPRVNTFLTEVHPAIQKLSETSVDFEAADALAKKEFSVTGNVFSNNRLLLGPVAIDNVTSYAVDTTLLKTMLNEHARMTTKVDREELEQLEKDNKVLENEYFGVVFDYKYILSRGGDENYTPKPGQLVVAKGQPEGEDGKGKVNVEFLGTAQPRAVELQGFIPLSKAQILKSGGGNAMTRYQKRARQIKFQSSKIAKYAEGVPVSLKKVAEPE